MTCGLSPPLPASTSTPWSAASTTSNCAGHNPAARRRDHVAVPFGVYVHIPFCARRCDYCAFATWTDRAHLMADYAAAIRADIDATKMPVATSVFFGGGTPSLLPAELLVGILDAITRADDAEVTVECNPETVTADLLRAYRSAGVTRISLGVQSMAPHVLAALGRQHDVHSVPRAVALIKDAGF